MMRVLVVEPRWPGRVEIIEPRLEVMQRLVGGYIQVVFPFEEPVALICNEEAKGLGLPLNRTLQDKRGDVYDIVAGTFFLSGVDSDGELRSLTDGELRTLTRRFTNREVFPDERGGVVVVPSPWYQPRGRGDAADE